MFPIESVGWNLSLYPSGWVIEYKVFFGVGTDDFIHLPDAFPSDTTTAHLLHCFLKLGMSVRVIPRM